MVHNVVHNVTDIRQTFRWQMPVLLAVLLPFLVAAWVYSLCAQPPPGNLESSRNENVSVPHSTSMAITRNGRFLLVANPDSYTVSLIDTATAVLLAEIPVGVDPRSVALAVDDSTAFVANQGSDTISVIDIAARQVLTSIPVGDRPVGAVVSPNGRFLAASELGEDAISFWDTNTLSFLSRHRVSDRPYGLAFTPDGSYLLISHLLSGSVTVLPAQPYWQYLPLVSQQASFNGQRQPLRAENVTLTREIPTWLHVAPAPAVVINAAGTRAYLPQTMANGLGLNTQFDTTVFPKVSVLNLATWTHQTSEHISLPETDQPVGLPWDAALARNDTELWIVNAASNDVSVIDITAPTQPTRSAHLPVGDNPRGIVFSPDETVAYVNNTLAGTVSVIDARAYTVTAVITATHFPLPPLLLNGKRLFHSSATPALAQARWIACNTCHIEGEHDGRTWLLPFTGDLPLGAAPVITRNTTSLLGMIETYPLRWSAEWDESADSEFSIRFEQFGEGLIAGDMHPTLGLPNQGRSYDLDSLAAFIDSLAAPARHHTLTAAEERGQVIFESPQTGCSSCHPPPLYTNLAQVDVGTAKGAGEWFGPVIDTPTLRFLYDSAPYLHDGSAATLLDVLTTRNLYDAHGVTSQLTAAELADLVAFLLALPYE